MPKAWAVDWRTVGSLGVIAANAVCIVVQPEARAPAGGTITVLRQR